MIRLGLLGYPLGHSLSPALHEAALHEASLQGEYALYSIRPGDVHALEDLIGRMRSGELTGLNVTIPHKQAVLGLLDEVTPGARRIGAVNTLYLRDGKVIGDNTDAPAFITDLNEFLPQPRSALILGAGGAARAVAYALCGHGCEVAVAARRFEQALELAAGFAGARAMELRAEDLVTAAPELIVNATPAGMFPGVEQRPWPPGIALPAGAAVYDLIYNPPETRLLKEARAAGLRARNGLGMLVEQAALAFGLWTGCEVDRQVLCAAARQTTSL